MQPHVKHMRSAACRFGAGDAHGTCQKTGSAGSPLTVTIVPRSTSIPTRMPASLDLTDHDEAWQWDGRLPDTQHLVSHHRAEHLRAADTATAALGPAHRSGRAPPTRRRPTSCRLVSSRVINVLVRLDRAAYQDGGIALRPRHAQQAAVRRPPFQPIGGIGLRSIHRDQPIPGHVQAHPGARDEVLRGLRMPPMPRGSNGPGAVMAMTFVS